MRAAASIWLRMSASSGETRIVGPAPDSRRMLGGDEVDRALAPAGALHEQHAAAVGDERCDRLELVVPKLGIVASGQAA